MSEQRGRTVADQVREEEERLQNKHENYSSLAEMLGVRDPKASEEAEPVHVGRMTAKEFSEKVLNSVQYRESVLRRILFDELPPAVECRMMDYAWGRPVEKVQVESTTMTMDDKSVEALEDRAKFLIDLARRMRSEERNTKEPALPPPSGNGESIH